MILISEKSRTEKMPKMYVFWTFLTSSTPILRDTNLSVIYDLQFINTNVIVVVSSKNIEICPFYGHSKTQIWRAPTLVAAVFCL